MTPTPYPPTSEFHNVIPPGTRFAKDGKTWNVMEVIPDPNAPVKAAPLDKPLNYEYIAPEAITPHIHA